MRTIIDLPEEQIRGLAEYCAAQHVSRAEAIRQAVNRLLIDCAESETQKTFDAAFGSWKKYGISTDEYLGELRSEWEG